MEKLNMTMLIPKLSTNDILLFQVVVKWSIQKDWKCWHSSTLLTKKYSQTTISSSFRIFCLCNIAFDQCFVRGGFVTQWSLPFPLEMHNGDSKQRKNITRFGFLSCKGFINFDFLWNIKEFLKIFSLRFITSPSPSLNFFSNMCSPFY